MTTNVTEMSEYTRAETDRVKAEGTIAVVHYETTLRGELTIAPEEIEGFLTAPVYTEEAAFLDANAEPAIVEDTVSRHIYAVTRNEDGPASAIDITAHVLHNEADSGELIGHVGVDSGVVMIGDPCYAAGEDTDALMEAIIAARGDVSTPRGDLGGIAVSTPLGDGVFPVYAHRDSDGRIWGVTVEFG